MLKGKSECAKKKKKSACVFFRALWGWISKKHIQESTLKYTTGVFRTVPMFSKDINWGCQGLGSWKGAWGDTQNEQLLAHCVWFTRCGGGVFFSTYIHCQRLDFTKIQNFWFSWKFSRNNHFFDSESHTDKFARSDQGHSTWPPVSHKHTCSLLYAWLWGQILTIFYCYPVLFFSSSRKLSCFAQYENESAKKNVSLSDLPCSSVLPASLWWHLNIWSLN